MSRYKKEDKILITFTKYAVRQEGREIKLSISKKMQEEFKFSNTKEIRKASKLESIKMIKIGKIVDGKCKVYIIYEKEKKRIEVSSNIMAIDLGMDNLAACTNMNNDKTLIIAGERIKSKIGYINKEISRLTRNTNENDRK